MFPKHRITFPGCVGGKHVAGARVLQKSGMCQHSFEGVVALISIIFINLGLT